MNVSGAIGRAAIDQGRRYNLDHRIDINGGDSLVMTIKLASPNLFHYFYAIVDYSTLLFIH